MKIVIVTFPSDHRALKKAFVVFVQSAMIRFLMFFVFDTWIDCRKMIVGTGPWPEAVGPLFSQPVGIPLTAPGPDQKSILFVKIYM